MDITFIHYKNCIFVLDMSFLSWYILIFSKICFDVWAACACVRMNYFQNKRTLRLHNIGCCKHMRSCRPSTWVSNKLSVSFWSTGTLSWIWGTFGQWVPDFQDYLLLLHNLMWGGAPNLLLSYLNTRFHSVITPWFVLFMDRMR